MGFQNAALTAVVSAGNFYDRCIAAGVPLEDLHGWIAERGHECFMQLPDPQKRELVASLEAHEALTNHTQESANG